MARSVKDRFWAKVDKKGPNDCWEWLGVKTKLGYGYMRYYKDGRRKGCHLVSLILHGIKIPKGKHTDHLCRNTSCINPKHLEIVTPRKNILRGVGPAAINYRKTHCKYGHELTGKNLSWNKRKNNKNQRRCKKCTHKKEK